MYFDFSDEQKSLKRAARAFLTEYSSSERVRKAMVTPLGYDPEVWRLIGTEMGWPALIIPEEYGGAGGTYVDLAAVMEECGYFLLCSPLFSTVMATNALLIAGSEEQKREYLPKIAAGELTATVALIQPFDGVMGQPAGRQAGTTALVTGNGYVLNGSHQFVIDGASANLVLVLGEESKKPRQITLFAVPGETPGIEKSIRTTMDQTRHQANIQFRDARIPLTSPVGPAREGWKVTWDLLHLTNVALVAESVGGAQRCLDMAVDYAKTRVQFNRAIGSFQAIKHKCAEMMMLVESSRSAAYYAAWSASDSPSTSQLPINDARVYSSNAYFVCASENLQIHGGIGFTQEHDAQLLFKRARASASILGGSHWHRDHVSMAW